MSYDQDQMLQEHQAVWSGFMKLCTYSVIAIVVLLILMAIFLL